MVIIRCITLNTMRLVSNKWKETYTMIMGLQIKSNNPYQTTIKVNFDITFTSFTIDLTLIGLLNVKQSTHQNKFKRLENKSLKKIIDYIKS